MKFKGVANFDLVILGSVALLGGCVLLCATLYNRYSKSAVVAFLPLPVLLIAFQASGLVPAALPLAIIGIALYYLLVSRGE